MPENAPSRFWVVQKRGTVVAKFDTVGETVVDPEITDHDAFQVQGIPDRANLEGRDVDTSVLTDEEREILGLPPGV